MMLPMKRSEVFKILSDIFSRDDIRLHMDMNASAMSESPAEPYDIDFRLDDTGKLVSYLRILNPPEDCVDGEYRFVYRVPKTQEASAIAINLCGDIRVEGADIDSFIYHAIKDNANRLADYAKKLTRTYHEQVADVVIYGVKKYCETLMNEHASDFDQMDISVSEGVCTEFLIRSINEPERNYQFDVVKHIDEPNINDNNIWVRFSKPYGWLWTPLVIKPSIGDIVINTEQCVFTNIFGAKEVVRLARLISEQTGFAISVIEGDSTRDRNIATKYIKSLLQKHEVLDTVKGVLDTVKNEYYIRGDVYRIRFLDSETLQTIKKADNIDEDQLTLGGVYSAILECYHPGQELLDFAILGNRSPITQVRIKKSEIDDERISVKCVWKSVNIYTSTGGNLQ